MVPDHWTGKIRYPRQQSQIPSSISRQGSSILNTSSDNKLAFSSESRSKYLWCVNHYGPNNQLKDFVKCAIIALITNYTLILPPLFPHYADEMKGMQWFDHFYDLKQLGFVINFTTLEQFIGPRIKTGINVTIDCYIQQIDLVMDKTKYSKTVLESVQAYFQTNIHFLRYRNLSRTLDMKELSRKMQICSSIFLHIHYSTLDQLLKSPNKYTALMFSYLTRSALIQRMAKKIIQLLPQLLVGGNSETNLTTLAVAHLRRGDRTVMSLSNYIRQIAHLIKTGAGFTHVYMMCPYLNTSDIAQITRDLSIPVTTTEKLLNHGHFVMDDYLFDVLEQEIAFQAPIFLASPLSTYSSTVVMQKLYQNKGIVYLFSTKSANRPFRLSKQNFKYFK
jgi:hypothetical protein